MTSTRRLRRGTRATPRPELRAQRCSSSLMVLGALGVLGLTFPLAMPALAAPPAPTELPVVRGVARGSVSFNIPQFSNNGASVVQWIDQASLRAIIDWKTFNIGRNAELVFNHLQGRDSSTLNRIYDANPSVIEGKLTSTSPGGGPGGQILLINQNGILFNRGAQVNTQSLIASTLNMSNEKFWSGAYASGGLTQAAFEGGYSLAGDGTTDLNLTPTGKIVIGGAGGNPDAAAPALRAGQGGSIMLFAPEIQNQGGVITSPDGQVILAAGSKVYLALSEDSSDFTLRGYVVEVAAPSDQSVNVSSLINNAGDISADRGNVTLAALAVNQNGRVTAKTAVQNNGSIYLRARAISRSTAEGPVYQGGRATFGAGSVTEVTPDTADTATIPQSEDYTQRRGAIEVDAKLIQSAGAIRAAGGRIALRAADEQDPSGARVYLDKGSETSVAGFWADVDYDSNFATFLVTSNELKNSPDQKNGILRGATTTVDLRKDSAILDLTGYRDARARSVAEKATAGGELLIESTGSVIQRQGAVIDASGGGYRYGAGVSTTSQVLGADGKIYDISSAPEMLPYVAQLDRVTKTSERWGQTRTYVNRYGHYGVAENGYVEGANGGNVTIKAGVDGGVVLDGIMKGGVTIGPNQLASAPRGASLTVGIKSTNPAEPDRLVGDITFTNHARDTLGSAFGATTALSPAQSEGFELAADTIFNGADGFGSVTLNSDGKITLPAAVGLQGNAGSSLTLRGEKEVRLAGSIAIAGGDIIVPGDTGNGSSSSVPANRVIVESSARLSTAGTWINNSNPDGSFVGKSAPSGVKAADGSTRSTINGGSINLASQSLRLEDGAVIDVGGGGSIDRSARIRGGDGGSLTLANGLSAESTPDWLRADLRGFAIGKGASLTVKTPQAIVTADGATGTPPPDTTRFGQSFFNDHGFGAVTIQTTRGALDISGIELHAQQKNLVVDPLKARTLATGGSVAGISTLTRLPDAARKPVDLTFQAGDTGTNSRKGVLTLSDNASIVADPRAKVSLTATDGLFVNGRIEAAGGSVALTLDARPVDVAATPALTLGDKAVISTAGTFLSTPNALGLTQGTVIGGGTVTIEARNAGVDLKAGSNAGEPGATIDVSGRHQVVDILDNGVDTPVLFQQAIDAPAGAVIIKSQGSTTLGGTFKAAAPSSGSAGGSFALEQTAPASSLSLPDTRRIVVTAGGTAVPAEAHVVDAVVAADKLATAGFDKLRLQSENKIEFRGDQTLNFARGIRVDAPEINVAGSSQVVLQGTSVAIGQSSGPRVLDSSGVNYVVDPLAPLPAIPTRAGDGRLTVQADTADLFGSLTVNGTKTVRIEAKDDIRLIGRTVQVGQGANATFVQTGGLTTAGNVELDAAQVYPTTRSSYSIAVKNVAADGTSTPVDDGKITVTNVNSRAPGPVYSAAGTLHLEADKILQSGVLKAPLGRIELKAGKELTLTPGSLTSVSADGLTIPYGQTVAGVQWTYQDQQGGKTPGEVGSVSGDGKTVTLNGDKVDVQAGATVDLRGGGDVAAIEFVEGSGGTVDATLKDNYYAIIPRMSNMPFDTDMASLKDVGFGFGSAKQDTAVYDSVSIGAGAIVPAGEYVLLPARYALMPGAYLVQLQTGLAYSNMRAGQTAQLQNGATVVAGFRSAHGTSARESQSIGVVVRPGSAIRNEAEYTVTGSRFFADVAARDRVTPLPLPQDAGRLAVERAKTLLLDGDFKTAAGVGSDGTPGRSASFDINGPKIAVVDQVDPQGDFKDYLQLSGAAISGLDGSVLLGGLRSYTTAGTRITTGAEEIVVANTEAGNADARELILAARKSIDIKENASLSASDVGAAAAAATRPTLLTESSGALVRLSNTGQAAVIRDAGSRSEGVVTIGANATLQAAKAVLIDATQNLRSAGRIRVGGQGGAGGSLSLASGLVSLGDAAASVDTGLVLTQLDIDSYAAVDELMLKAYDAIDIHASHDSAGAPIDTRIGSDKLKALTLDTALLRNPSGRNATIAAKDLSFTNTTGNGPAGSGASGTGTLTMTADRITFGAGDKRIDGWSAVTTTAHGAVVAQGSGSLSATADWTVVTPKLLTAAAANQRLSARDGAGGYKDMTLKGDAAGAIPLADAADTGLGGRLTLEGRDVDVGTTVQALSGRLNVTAANNLTLSQDGKLDARGAIKDFNGTAAIADGGVVTLAAGRDTGTLKLGQGSTVDVSAAAGGNAGSVQITAGVLDAAGGELRGSAAADKRSGSAAIELASLAAFSALNDVLNGGGFAESRALRVRSGDITVAGTDRVLSRDVTLSADAGAITLKEGARVGSGASTGRGAAIGLYAGTDVTLEKNSVIDASSSGAGANGGQVHVEVQNGNLAFQDGAVIDVSKGEGGRTGSVTFTLPRAAGDTDLPAANPLAHDRLVGTHELKGTVRSQRNTGDAAATVAVEGRRVYDIPAGTADAAVAEDYAAHHADFLENTDAATLLGDLKGDAGRTVNAVLRGATELRSSGDLNVTTALQLGDETAWRAAHTDENGLPTGMAGALTDGVGTLTLRAAGNVTISNSIGSLNDNIVDGNSWNIRAVAGADMSAADPSTTVSLDKVAANSGNLLLTGASAKLRTGTGRIDLAAARDFKMDNAASVVYTAGRIGAADVEPRGNNRWGTGGGDITVRAGNDIVGPASPSGDPSVNDWLRRPKMTETAFLNSTLKPTDWWVYRPNFKQAVGTLAGGNIDVTAGRDVSNFSVVLPTTGRTYLDTAGQRRVDVQGGGDLRLLAGNDIVGGTYLVSRGEGRVEAVGDIGRDRATKALLMGASNGAVPSGASIDLVAGRSLHLASVGNPTANAISGSSGVTGVQPPSFGGGVFPTFFTYADNSAANLQAKTGDVAIDGNGDMFPPNLSVVAFAGNLSGGDGTPMYIFPSSKGRVKILADGSISKLNLSGSDADPALLPNISLPPGGGTFLATIATQVPFDKLGMIDNNGQYGRLVERDMSPALAPFVFDIQALNGSFLEDGQGSKLALPAKSRVRAGQDILKVKITLQNLSDADVSEVRADQGDVRPAGAGTTGREIEIRGPGRLLVQAGRDVELGQDGRLIATGNVSNPGLTTADSARITVIAGVRDTVDLAKLDASYALFLGIAENKALVLSLFKTLDGDTNRGRVASAGSVAELAALDGRYASFAGLGDKYPQVLRAYQSALNGKTLPLGNSAEAGQADALYRALNASTNVSAIQNARSIADLAKVDASFQPYVGLDQNYPRVFAEFKLRMGNGVNPVPVGMSSVLYADVYSTVVNEALPVASGSTGNIRTFQTSVQTFAGSDIDLWAPNGSATVGLTTVRDDTSIGIITNAGGAIHSVVHDNFAVNKGKVLTAQGGDVVILSTAGNIDAGRGAKTSLSTPPPIREPIMVEGVLTGYRYLLPSSASGSGIQTLTSDPDGLGPRIAPPSGTPYLLTPAGVVDAGEAGIRSSGNVFIDALQVNNGANISFGGTGTGVPVTASGSLAASLASSGNNSDSGSKSVEEAAKNATESARAATAAGTQKANILTVEVMGFGDKNCKEQDKDCFAK